MSGSGCKEGRESSCWCISTRFCLHYNSTARTDRISAVRGQVGRREKQVGAGISQGHLLSLFCRNKIILISRSLGGDSSRTTMFSLSSTQCLGPETSYLTLYRFIFKTSGRGGGGGNIGARD